jgi:hypothetical protein
MNVLSNRKFQQLSPEDMSAISGGKKTTRRLVDITYNKIPCPEGFSEKTECFTSTAHYDVYKKVGVKWVYDRSESDPD